MNRPGCFLLAFLLLFLATACKELASTPGGGGGISSVPQERLATPINFVAESGAGLAADSGNVGSFAPEPYLGTWEGDEYINFAVGGIPMLEGTYHLEITILEDGKAVAITDAVDDLGPIKLAILRGYVATMQNIDHAQTHLAEGRVATTGAYWEKDEGKGRYLITLAVIENPRKNRVRFLGPDKMIFYWKMVAGGDSTTLYRK